jgi:hypothetical protein
VRRADAGDGLSVSDEPATAYAPPAADVDINLAARDALAPNALRALAIIFLIRAGAQIARDVFFWAVGAGLVDGAQIALTVATLLIGLGLWRRPAALRWLALLGDVVLSFSPTIVRLAALPGPFEASMLLSVVAGLGGATFTVLPTALLTLGRPGRARVVVASVVFALSMALVVVGTITMWMFRRDR